MKNILVINIQRTVYFLAATLLAITILLSARPANAASAPQILYFAKDPATTGSDLYIQVRANTGSRPVNAVQADFTYPSSILTFVAIDSSSSAFSITASEDEDSGTISIQRGNSPSKTGDLLVSIVHFTVSGSGNGDFSYLVSSALVNGSSNLLDQTIDTRFSDVYGFFHAVYSLYHAGLRKNFFTINTAERSSLIAAGWQNRGIAFYALPSTATGAIPVYSLYHAGLRKNFFTVSVAERNKLIAAGWMSRGIAFYALPSNAPGAIPVYSLYHSGLRKNFFTTSSTERDTLIANGWQDRGIGFYALP